MKTKVLFTKKDMRTMLRNGLPAFSPKLKSEADVRSGRVLLETLKAGARLAKELGGKKFYLCCTMGYDNERYSLNIQDAITNFQGNKETFGGLIYDHPQILSGTAWEGKKMCVLEHGIDFRSTWISIMEERFNRKAARFMARKQKESKIDR